MVGEPAAWPTTIEAHRPTITGAANDPGGGALLALLEAGAHVLVADRWLTVMVALRRTWPPPSMSADPLWAALATIHTWSDSCLPALLADRAQALAALWATLDPLDGWPAALPARWRNTWSTYCWWNTGAALGSCRRHDFSRINQIPQPLEPSRNDLGILRK